MSEWKLPDDVVEPSIEGSGGGSFLWESGLYDATVKLAYVTQSAGGAYFLNVELEKNGGNFGTMRDKWCIKSGNEKGNKTFLGFSFLSCFVERKNILAVCITIPLNLPPPKSALYSVGKKQTKP